MQCACVLCALLSRDAVCCVLCCVIIFTAGFLRASDSQDYQMFGYAVCIHNSTIVVGAYGDSSSGSYTGAVYLFRKTYTGDQDPQADNYRFDINISSTHYEWVEIQKLVPSKSHLAGWLLLSHGRSACGSFIRAFPSSPRCR